MGEGDTVLGEQVIGKVRSLEAQGKALPQNSNVLAAATESAAARLLQQAYLQRLSFLFYPRNLLLNATRSATWSRSSQDSSKRESNLVDIETDKVV